jgi:hypothetical protein
MPEKSVLAHGLAKIEIRPGADSAVLLLTNTKGVSHGYILNPEALGAILAEGLRLAATWAEKPDLGLGNLTGRGNALPANRISIVRGRNNKECAVRVFVGKMELTFLIPLDDVISAMGAIVTQIDPDSGLPAH